MDYYYSILEGVTAVMQPLEPLSEGTYAFFRKDKSAMPKRVYRIGEIAREIGITPQALRLKTAG